MTASAGAGRALVTGAGGMLGHDLVPALRAGRLGRDGTRP